MLTVIGVVLAVIGVIWTRKTEIVVHDPLEGAKPPRGERLASPLQALERAVEVARAEAARAQTQAEDVDLGDDEDEDFGGPITSQDIADLVAEGRHIEAIKLYRQATGADLGRAKAFIDALRSRSN